MNNQIINIHNTNSVINAIGKHNSKHTKAVVCKEIGHIYSSIKDAANAAGVHYVTMVNHLNHPDRYKTVKGKHYGYLRDVLDNPDCMLAQLRDTNAELDRCKQENAAELERHKRDAEDARKWRQYQAELERIRKEEEKRLEAERKAEEERQERIEKLTTRLERLTKRENEAYAKADAISAKRQATQTELAELLGENR